MEFLNTVLELAGINLIKALFMSVLIIIPFNYLFKNKVDTYYALQILRGIILGYCFLVLLRFIFVLVVPSGNESHLVFIQRVTGPYSWAYWTMFLFHVLLPFTLLIKRLGTNIYFLFLIAVLMNIGWLFESFVMHLTTLQREYAMTDDGSNPYLPFVPERLLLVQGLCFGLLIVLLGNIIKKYSQAAKTPTP